MHQKKVEELIVGATPPKRYCILMHGRTLNAAYMRDIAEKLAVDDIHYLFPEADGNSWYPESFTAPLEANEPSLSAALWLYERTVAGLLDKGVPNENIAVGGFSQGACLTAEYLARSPRRLGAAIIWTGGLIGPAGTTWPAENLRDMPAYITTSMVDPFVPVWRVRETEKWLRSSRANVTVDIFPQREHCVSEPELAAARTMLTNLARN